MTVDSAPEFEAMTLNFNNLLCVSDWANVVLMNTQTRFLL